MRTEVKIGLIVGMVVLGAGIVFFLNQGGSPDMADVVPLQKPTSRAEPGTQAGETAQDTGSSARHTAAPSGRRSQTPGPDGRPTRDTMARRGTNGQSPQPSTPTLGDTRRGLQPGRPTTTTQPAQPRSSTAIPAPGPSQTPRPEAPTTQPQGTGTSAPPQATTQPAASPAQPLPDTADQPRPGVSPPPRRDTETRTGGPATRLPADSGTTRHTIEIGDSLWLLAARYYDDGTLWPRIKAANPDLDEARLIIGQIIIIPPKEGAPTPTRQDRPTPSGSEPSVRRHTYVIERGDTLIGIARNVLKDGSRWQEILELNKDKIPDPNVLTIGTELLLPRD